MARFLMNVIIDEISGCWNWPGLNASKGKGTFYDGDRDVLARSFAYKKLVGEIPKGKQISMVCNNPCCVFPEHMKLVTHSEKASVNKGRHWVLDKSTNNWNLEDEGTLIIGDKSELAPDEEIDPVSGLI